MLSVKQIQNIQAATFLGKPSNFNEICKIYPLTIGEIFEIGFEDYNAKLGLLLLTETQIIEIIKEKTGQDIPIEEIEPLTYLLISADQSDRFLLELQSAFSTFVKEEVLFLPKINSILIGNPSEKRLITPKNFRDFQDILRIQNRKEVAATPPENETPGERKMRLLREKVAEVKRKQAQKNNEEQSLAEMFENATVFGIDVKNTTLYAFYGLLNKYQLREKWNADLQMICAGADSKKVKIKYWGEGSKNE